MADCELITSTRAKYNLNNLSTTTDEDTTIAELIKAVSVAIEKYCGRRFCSDQHDELYAGNGQQRLLLRHYPVISVERVAYAPVTVLQITNTSASNQRATVAVTSTGLSLVRVASGTSATDTVAFSSNATITAVKTAVDALGNGWSATIPDSDYANFASADLRAIQGALFAKDVQAGLKIHVMELPVYQVDATRGQLSRRHGLDLLAVGADAGGPAWFGGEDYWRIIYSAGFSTVPEDVQEACAQWVAALFWQTKRDPGLAQEQIPDVVFRIPGPSMPIAVKQLLAPYRARRFIGS